MMQQYLNRLALPLFVFPVFWLDALRSSCYYSFSHIAAQHKVKPHSLYVTSQNLCRIQIHQLNCLFLGQSVSSEVRSITISTLALSILLGSTHAVKAQNPQKAVYQSSRFRHCSVICNIKPLKLVVLCTFLVSFAEKIQSFHHSVCTSTDTI